VADEHLGEAEGDERTDEERDPYREHRLPGAVVRGHRTADRQHDEERRPDEVLGERVVLRDVRGDVPSVGDLEPGRVLLRVEPLHRVLHDAVEPDDLAVSVRRPLHADDHDEDRHPLGRRAARHLSDVVAVGELAEQILARGRELLEVAEHVGGGALRGPTRGARLLPRDPPRERIAQPLQLRLLGEQEQARAEELLKLVGAVLHPSHEILGRPGQLVREIVGEHLERHAVRAVEDDGVLGEAADALRHRLEVRVLRIVFGRSSPTSVRRSEYSPTVPTAPTSAATAAPASRAMRWRSAKRTKACGKSIGGAFLSSARLLGGQGPCSNPFRASIHRPGPRRFAARGRSSRAPDWSSAT
jgi:hypothetical protein